MTAQRSTAIAGVLVTVVVALGAAADHRVAWLAAAGVAVSASVSALRARPRPISRWRRGWGVLAVSSVGATLAPAVPIGSAAASLAAGTAAVLGLVATVATPVGRDPVHRRALLLRSVITGALVAFVGIATGVTTEPGWSVVLGAQVAVITALAVEGRRLAGDRRHPEFAVPERGLLLAHLLLAGAWALAAIGGDPLAAIGGDPLDATVVAMVSVSAVVAAVTFTHGELADPVPVPGSSATSLGDRHLATVVLAVAAGPLAVTGQALGFVEVALAPLATTGTALALAAVLHLAVLVRDHGRRAWRARYDTLTGLPSEALFDDRLERALATARRRGSSVAIAFLDLDGFKTVNDRAGHETGDVVLREVADRLRGALREQDTVARRSGDEFLVLLPDVAHPEDVETVAAKLLDALSVPIVVGNVEHRVGASIGLAAWRGDDPRAATTIGQADPAKLVRRADAAMYEAKDAPGSALRWWSSSSTALAGVKRTLGEQLTSAIEGGELELCYQPCVDLEDGQVRSLVARLWWPHPMLGSLPPDSVARIAAETTRSAALELATIERAAAQVGGWHVAGWSELTLAVTLGHDTVTDLHLEDELVSLLGRTGLPPGGLQVRVDAELLADPVVRGHLFALVARGVAVTATGVATRAVVLAELVEVVTGLELHHPDLVEVDAMVSAVVAAGAALALEVTVAGIDDEAHVAQMWSRGVLHGRGGGLAPTVDADTMDARLAGPSSAGGAREPLLASDLDLDGRGGDHDQAAAGDTAELLEAVLHGTDPADVQLLAVVLAQPGAAPSAPQVQRRDQR